MNYTITESKIAGLVLELLSALHYEYCYGPDIAPEGENSLPESYSDVVLNETTEK